jgi:hypothetical protein
LSRTNLRGKKLGIALDKSKRKRLEEKKWQFVAREAAFISRLGWDLSSPSLSDDQRAEALEHILRAATRLRQFADRRMKQAASRTKSLDG